jgi:hypothetical protein
MRDMSKKNQMSYSSFWLDSSIFDEDTSSEMNKTERKSSDLMKLMAYKRSISNFVSIVTGKSIPVTFDGRGDDSYTDGNQVVISAKLDDKEFDPVVGLALHEGSHISLTDFEILTSLNSGYLPHTIDKEWLANKYSCDVSDLHYHVRDNLKSLLNYVEDRRIDNHIYTSAPGYRGYYESMYDKYFHSNVIDKGLQSSEKRDEDWESYMFRIINLTNENRDLNALNGLREIWNVLDLRNISRLKTSWDALDVAGEILMVVEKNISFESQNGESQGSGDGESQSDGDQNGESPMSGNVDDQPTNENGMNANGNGETSPSNSEGSDDENGEDDGDSEAGSFGGPNQNGAGGQYEPLSDRQRKMLENAIEKQEKFLDGDIKKTKISKGDKNKIDQLDKADIQSEVTGKGLQQGWYGSKLSGGVQTYVIRNVNKGLIESGMIGMLNNSKWTIERGEANVNKGIVLGTQLGKKLKTRNEDRVLTTPRMKSGKLSGRMIHEIGFGNFDIFEQTLINKSTPVLLHISIDASSSMSGNKWNNTQVAAVAIAKAASMTENISVVISYRGVYYSGGHYGNCQPLMLIAYDSRKDKFSKIQQLFKHINYDGTTPVGLCYEAVLKELTQTKNGTDTYLINFSDGYPGFDNAEINYGGQMAIEHTADQVKKIRQAGVKVLSYFISDGYGYGTDSFKTMYGKDSEFIDVSSVAQLAKTLNKKFEVKI